MRASMKRRTRRNFRHIDVVKWKIFSGSQKFFMKNGKLLLEERISLFHGKVNPIRCFSVDELNAMITGLNDDLPDEYKWFNGDFDGRPVLIKVRKYDRIGCLFREIAVAAQMSTHKNAPKLLGCCLETEHPILVYDNNNVHYECLRDRMFVDENHGKGILGWNDRLRIAWEISHSVAYLHSAFPRPIVHRDLKPSHVLLDKDNAAKLSGFLISISMPEGEPYLLLDSIAGTVGYIAPECLEQAKLTEKSDVFSFGVLFLEIITGKGPSDGLHIFDSDSDDGLHWFAIEVAHISGAGSDLLVEKLVRGCLKNKHINKVFDLAIINGAGAREHNEDLLHRQLKASIKLALNCIAGDTDSRPTMEEVANELNSIITMNEFSISTPNTGSMRESDELSNEAEEAGDFTKELLLTRHATSSNLVSQAVKWKIFSGNQKVFMKNGMLLLKDRMSLFRGQVNPIRCFSADELNAMITKVNHDLSSEFKWYDGNVEGRPVLIKLQNNHVGCLVHETAIAAQMSTHNNVLKLFG